MPFKIDKAKPNPELITSVMYRVEGYDLRDALTRALYDSGKSGQQLVDEMVKHCLTEAGYFKPPVKES